MYLWPLILEHYNYLFPHCNVNDFIHFFLNHESASSGSINDNEFGIPSYCMIHCSLHIPIFAKLEISGKIKIDTCTFYNLQYQQIVVQISEKKVFLFTLLTLIFFIAIFG
jgi:hypothetical protein